MNARQSYNPAINSSVKKATPLDQSTANKIIKRDTQDGVGGSQNQRVISQLHKDDLDEPLLQDNPNRYVMFPLQDMEI